MDVKGMVSGCCLYFFCRKEEHFTHDISTEQQKKRVSGRSAMSHTHLTQDLGSSLIPFHLHGAKSDPWTTFGEGVVVGLVLIL